jgi:hypothetical protein
MVGSAVTSEPSSTGGSRALWIFAIAAVLIGSIAAAVAVALTSSDGEDEPDETASAGDEPDDELDEWLRDEDDEMPERNLDDPMVPGDEPSRGWESGREERFRDPERRAERLRRRIQIASLGTAPPTITHEEVWRGLRDVRPAIRECMEQAGGFGAFRGQGPREGRGGRTVRVDIGSDGRVVPGSVSIEPPPPPELATCMKQAFESATFEDVGADGARVSLSMGRRRGNRNAGDGGVDRRRRDRGGGERPNRERREREGSEREGAGEIPMSPAP